MAGVIPPVGYVEPRWLSIDQASTYLGCSRQTLYRQTLYRLILLGDLKPDGRVGRRLLFSHEIGDLATIVPADRGCYPLPVAWMPWA